jgi:hypothetical protein
MATYGKVHHCPFPHGVFRSLVIRGFLPIAANDSFVDALGRIRDQRS